jgi:hypothetical protein
MSQDSDQSASSPKSEVSPTSAAPSTVSPPKSTERKRGSLKEMAARASQAGAASRPGSVAPPAPQSRTSSTNLVSPTTTPLPSRPSEAGREDSGIVDLNVVNASATPEQKAAAEKAQPAAQGLFDDQDEKPKVAQAATVVKISDAKPQEKKKGSGGIYAGVAIAVLGVAAAFAITMNKPAPQQPTTATETSPAAPAPKAEETPPSAEKAPVAAAETTAQPAGEPGEATAPTGGGEKVAAAPGNGTAGAQQPTGGSATPPADEKAAEATEKPSTPPATPEAPAKPGDLKGAMAAAVGGDGKKETPTAEQAEPAAGSRNQSIPEQPPQGSVQAAIRAVMPGAKACVAGADDVSRAQVTFASNGTVKSVSVSGWAASHNQTACIKAALQGANVGPFSKSAFTTGFPIRP